MERQGGNAKKVVAFLATHPKVKRILFPGLKSMGDKQLEIYKNQCLAPGAMIGFVVDNSESSAFKVLNSLKMIKLSNLERIAQNRRTYHVDPL